jgi:hypothetical protein
MRYGDEECNVDVEERTAAVTVALRYVDFDPRGSEIRVRMPAKLIESLATEIGNATRIAPL